MDTLATGTPPTCDPAYYEHAYQTRDEWRLTYGHPAGYKRSLFYERTYSVAKVALQATPLGGTVLEIGSGTGVLANTLAESRLQVDAVDVSPTAVAAALERYGESIGWYVADAHDLSEFPENQYDTVVMSEVLEHLAAPHLALREARRVITNGGTLITSTPLKWAPANVAHRVKVWTKNWPREHLHQWTRLDVDMLHTLAGFTISGHATTNPHLPWPLDKLGTLNPKLGTRLWNLERWPPLAKHLVWTNITISEAT